MTEFSEEEMLKDLQARTRALPREVAPPDDAWTAIKAEIERPAVRSMQKPAHQSPRFWQRPGFLAAAGVLLMAGSSIVTMTVVRKTDVNTPSIQTTRTTTTHRETGPSTFAEFASVENDYIGSVNQLSAVLESERSTLSPETVAKLRKSLEVIDAAILEARRALAADPANKAIVDMLNKSYNQKLDLLRRTTEMGRT